MRTSSRSRSLQPLRRSGRSRRFPRSGARRCCMRRRASSGSRQEELARQMTLETGNAIWETRVEVQRTAEILDYAAEESRRMTGEFDPHRRGGRAARDVTADQALPGRHGARNHAVQRSALARRAQAGPSFAAGNPCVDPTGVEDAALGAFSRGDLGRGGRSRRCGQRCSVRDRSGGALVRDGASRCCRLPGAPRWAGACARSRRHSARDARARRQRRGHRP